MKETRETNERWARADDQPPETRSRRLWKNNCIGWGIFWGALGLLGFLPGLVMAALSFAMMALPIGVRD